jgi:P-type Cu+ transporter
MKHVISGGVTKDTPRTTYRGKTYYFCCAACKPAFDKSPARYVKAAAGTPVSRLRPGNASAETVCPVMKHALAGPVTASTPHSTYQGKTYYFCCPACKPVFEKNPSKYVHAKGAKP